MNYNKNLISSSTSYFSSIRIYNHYNSSRTNSSHSNFNELALSFPLEKYTEESNIDVWPVQILNILFYKGKTFNKMSQFFNKSLSLDIDLKYGLYIFIL